MNFSWKNSKTKMKLFSIMSKNKVNKLMILAPSGAQGMQICLSALSQLSLSFLYALSQLLALCPCPNANVIFLFLDSGEYECKVETDNGKTYKESFVLKVEPKPKLKFEEECEDNTKLAKCHLIVAAKLCNKSSDLARYF